MTRPRPKPGKATAGPAAARPRGRKPRPRGGPYDDAILGANIDRARISRDMKVEEFCERMNAPDPEFPGLPKWDDGTYSRKTRGETPLWFAEIGKIKKFLRLPYGCPFIEERDGWLLEQVHSDAAVAVLIQRMFDARRP